MPHPYTMTLILLDYDTPLDLQTPGMRMKGLNDTPKTQAIRQSKKSANNPLSTLKIATTCNRLIKQSKKLSKLVKFLLILYLQ